MRTGIFRLQHGLSLIVLSLFAGCGPDPSLLYEQVKKQHADTIQDPAKARRSEFQNTVAALQKLAENRPRWKQAAEARLLAARLYQGRKEFAQAREEARQVCTEYPERPEWCADAIFFQGEMFESEGSMQNAVREYEHLYDRYAMTEKGLAAPLYVAELYWKASRHDESVTAYRKAVRHYISLIQKNPYGKKILQIQDCLLRAYEGTGAWHEAAGTFETLAGAYPGTRCAPAALYQAADIYEKKLALYDNALETFRKIIAIYPQSETAQKASLRLVLYYAGQGDLDTARDELNELERRFPRRVELRAAGHLAIAEGYEKADKWQYASQEYRDLQKDYPNTIEEVRAYIATARQAAAERQKGIADKDLRRAVAAAEKIRSRKDGRGRSGEASLLLAEAYGMQGRWDASAAALEEFAAVYSSDPYAAAALLKAGTIQYTQCKETAKARALVEQALARATDPAVISEAHKILAKIK